MSASVPKRAAALRNMGRQIESAGSQLHEPVLEPRHRRRKVNASTTGDISGKYDFFGTNSYQPGGNPWADFFGAPAHPWKTTSYDDYDRHNYNLPEAYHGKAETLAQTVDELIYTDEDFYTTVCLPYNFTNNVSVQWDKWVFNDHFTGVVPEQGVSRLVSSHREARSETFLRRGLGLILEHGWMSTPEGRAQYTLSLLQIARAVKETTDFGVIYAYLTCQDYGKEWERKHGYNARRSIYEMLQREKFFWAIVVKEKNGLEKLDAHIIEWMGRNRTSADTWLMPVKPATYLRLVPQEKTDYYLAGQEGPNRVNNIRSAGHPTQANAPGKRLHDVVEPYALFKKNQVFLTRTYNIDRTGPIDLMTKLQTQGDYFKIVSAEAATAVDSDTGYKTKLLDTRIYDEDSDSGYTVTAIEAIMNCMVFDANTGKPRVPDGDMSAGAMDANDLAQCFFLQPNGEDSGFEPIKRFGDIDVQFFDLDDARDMARTVIQNVFKGNEESVNSDAVAAAFGVEGRLVAPGRTVLVDTDISSTISTIGKRVVEALGGKLPQGVAHAESRENVEALLDFMEANPQATTAASASEVGPWVAKLRSKLPVQPVTRFEDHPLYKSYMAQQAREEQYENEEIGMMYGLNRDPEISGKGEGARIERISETLRQNYNRLYAESTTLSDEEKLIIDGFFQMPWTRQNCLRLARNNVLLPFNFLGFRMGLYDMALAIKCKAGIETGATYFGNSSFELADDAVTKMHYGNYTHYGKSVIHRPENVFVAYNIFPNRALGGMGTRPYTDATQYNPHAGVTDADIFYIMVPYKETRFPDVMSMAGRFYTHYDDGLIDENDPTFRQLHYTTAAFYNRIWKWYSDENVAVELDDPMYYQLAPTTNTLVWQGPQANYNPGKMTFDRDIIRNKGPWGDNITAGEKDVRNGMMRTRTQLPPGILGF